MVEGYCAKCKNRKAIAEGVEETMKNGRVAYKGRCASCGSEVLKIIGENGDALGESEKPPATSNDPENTSA